MAVAIKGSWVRNKNQTMCNFIVEPNSADLDVLAQMAEAGKLKPIIERTVTLAQVPQAMSDYMEKGASGKIAIDVYQADRLA
jgi:NADPH:quinone reductase-like Zn-dependent oxidoreductase